MNSGRALNHSNLCQFPGYRFDGLQRLPWQEKLVSRGIEFHLVHAELSSDAGFHRSTLRPAAVADVPH